MDRDPIPFVVAALADLRKYMEETLPRLLAEQDEKIMYTLWDMANGMNDRVTKEVDRIMKPLWHLTMGRNYADPRLEASAHEAPHKHHASIAKRASRHNRTFTAELVALLTSALAAEVQP